MNIPLKIAIVESRKKNYEIEREAGLPHSKLSRIVHEVTYGTIGERKRIATVLMVPVEKLFNEPTIAA